jgi:anthranilate phosphoribosyltransferase
MESAVGTILDGACTDAQIGAFLAALRIKGETAEELLGAVRAVRSRAIPFRCDGLALDTCGTGGDGTGTFNVSTAASFVVAAAGIRVVKHGNRAASSRAGAADVLEALGAKVTLSPASAERCLAETGICFLFAPTFHPALSRLAGPRRDLGFRTLFNLTGPLCNPAGVKRQLIGVFGESWLLPVAHALHALGSERAMVVHGADGCDEISSTGPTTIVELGEGRLDRYHVEPRQFGLTPSSLADLAGGDAARNAEIIRAVLGGREGPQADIVALNAGAALYLGGHDSTLHAGVLAARELILGGEGLRRLDAFVKFTRSEEAA